MSWLFGFVGPQLSSENASRFQALHPAPDFSSQSSKTYFAAGGLPETCFYGWFSNQPLAGAWAVCGIGLESSEQNCRFLNAADWRRILSTENVVDFAGCGSSWLTFNQIGYQAFLKNVRRLGPNGFAALSPTSTRLHHKLWTPDPHDDGQDFVERLEALLNPMMSKERVISLALSGGLDSRTLLALLISSRRANFGLHVFGVSMDPDVRLSQAIARNEKLPQDYFDNYIPNGLAGMQLLRDYASQTQFIEPASTVLKLRYGSQLYHQKKIAIDGGFGEIARRQFLNRLLLKGKSALHSGDPRSIYPYLRVQRPAIFVPEVLQMMRQGAEEQIAALWQEMSSIHEFGCENFLDLLAVRTRLANAYGFEQSRLDGEGVSYMPFAQPSLLNGLFKTAVTTRKNGRLFRQVIRQRAPQLAQYPLVKGGTTYPFYFSTVPAWAWTKLKTELGKTFADVSANEFLQKMAAEVQDLVNSASVKSYPAYDYPFIRDIVEKFYRGQTAFAAQVHWWLSFEMWRSAVKA